MRLALFTLMSVVSAVALSATVYKWVDENGVTHYSDQPHENAEKVQVAAPQTYKAPAVPSRTAAQPGRERPPNAYESCAVVSPANEETLPNTYSVTTSVQVSPAPRDGDHLVVLFDGKPLPGFPAAGGSFTISDIDRGTHTVQAMVQDPSGKVLCQSPNVSFTVLQPSVLNPANPNFRH
jgi:Domain of unknown function (DUF4124)